MFRMFQFTLTFKIPLAIQTVNQEGITKENNIYCIPLKQEKHKGLLDSILQFLLCL